MNEFDYKGWVHGNIVDEEPTSSSSAGTANQMYITEGAIYVCVEDNHWQKAALSDF